MSTTRTPESSGFDVTGYLDFFRAIVPEKCPGVNCVECAIADDRLILLDNIHLFQCIRKVTSARGIVLKLSFRGFVFLGYRIMFRGHRTNVTHRMIEATLSKVVAAGSNDFHHA